MSRLYRASKITDQRFRRLLGLYVRDLSATDAARTIGFSINTVHGVYRKLRVFFFEVGLFVDFYDGVDPLEFASDDPQFEHRLLAFHLARIAAKRGLKSPADEPPYHFAESCWRYDFQVLMEQRPSDAVHAMMLAQLLEIIRICGPVGGAPRNRADGLVAAGRFVDQRILWLRRNARGFATPELRSELEAAHSILVESDATPLT